MEDQEEDEHSADADADAVADQQRIHSIQKRVIMQPKQAQIIKINYYIKYIIKNLQMIIIKKDLNHDQYEVDIIHDLTK